MENKSYKPYRHKPHFVYENGWWKIYRDRSAAKYALPVTTDKTLKKCYKSYIKYIGE